jgi:hypothetical protein
MATLLGIDAGRVAVVATFYKASELLGAGRYSEVYKAFDTNSQTDVALKLYIGFDNAAHEIAKNEASLLTRLGALNSEYFPALRRRVKHRIKNRNHPLLVLELGSHVGDDGQKRVISLKDVIPAAASSIVPAEMGKDFWCINSVISWMLHMVQAVKQIHSIGLVHRDIKPANILVKRGPGQSQAVPFLLDFNSASDVWESDSGRGTPRYLPPEVKLGRRLAPSPEDDLWAIAMVAWEMLFGPASSPDSPEGQLAVLNGIVPEPLVACLLRALNVNPESRYRTADEIMGALEACLPAERAGGLSLTSDEISRARMEMDRIRRIVGQVFAPPGQIVIPKEIDDTVTTIFAWLSQEDSQALNLVDEIVKLGPAAIPACLQQGYRLQNKAGGYDEVVFALGELATMDRSLAQRSIDAFALSSNRGVRELCWRTCETLKYFPEALLTSVTTDEGLLLPEERLRLAELCVRFSAEPTAVPALVKYMCREYVLDKSRYREIRDKVARRMGEVQCDRTAEVIWEACRDRVWTDLADFQNVPAGAQPEVESGLIELLGDAFAATSDSGLRVLTTSKNQRVAGMNRESMFRRFAVKSGRRNANVRAWLMDESSRSPDDKTLRRIVEAVSERREEKREDPRALLREYLKQGDSSLYNQLRFLKNRDLFESLETHLSSECPNKDIGLILKLLRGFQSRNRLQVIDVLLGHWRKLAEQDYRAAAEILSAYPNMLTTKQREGAINILNRDLGGVYRETARRTLELLLK